MILGITYEGLAMSEAHNAWLDRLMDKAAFAILCEESVVKTNEDKQLRADIHRCFSSFIDEGRVYLANGQEEKADGEKEEVADEGDEEDEA